VSKFVGKFRKNKDYNDDMNYSKKRSKNEHAEIKKLKKRNYEELMSTFEELPITERPTRF
jgi:hypothetical protein